mgnify:CR=1 FL=1
MKCNTAIDIIIAVNAKSIFFFYFIPTKIHPNSMKIYSNNFFEIQAHFKFLNVEGWMTLKMADLCPTQRIQLIDLPSNFLPTVRYYVFNTRQLDGKNFSIESFANDRQYCSVRGAECPSVGARQTPDRFRDFKGKDGRSIR